MLQIKTDSGQLDLKPGTVINIKLQSPIFSKDFIPDFFSFGFTLADTSNNKRILNNHDIIEKPGTMEEAIEASLFIHGALIFKGSIKVLNAKQLRIRFQGKPGQFKEKVGIKSLKDFNYEGQRTLPSASVAALDDHLEDRANGTVDDYDYTFAPIENLSFASWNSVWGSMSYSPYTNYYPSDNFVNSYTWFLDENNVSLGDRNYAISPYPYLKYVLEELTKESGFNLVSDWLSETEIKSLVLFTNRILKVRINWDPTLNYVDTNDSYIDFRIAELLPDITVGKFLISLKNLFNLGVFFSFIEDEMEIKPIRDILNSVFVEDLSIDAEEETDIIPPKQPSFTFHMKDSELELSEYNPDDIFELFNYKGEVDTVANLPGLGVNRDMYLVKNINSFYNWTGAWSFLVANQFDYIYGLGEQTIETQVTPASMIEDITADIGSVVRSWIIPQVDHAGSIPEIPSIGINELDPRLMFYRGKQNDSVADGYPLLSPDVYRYDGTKIASANYALRWPGEYGLFETWWESFIEFISNTKIVKFNLNWNIADILRFRFQHIYRIHGNDYLVESLNIRISVNGIESVKANCYKR